MSSDLPSAAVRNPRWAWSLVALSGLAASFASLWLRLSVPIPVAPQTGDDVVYARLAASLLQGRWLGDFDQYTLARGPAYPALIATSFWMHIPLKAAEQLTYLLACAVIACCIWTLTQRAWLVGAAYVILALNPVNFSVESAMIYRDSWHASLCLLLVGLAFLLGVSILSGPARRLIVLSLLAGTALAVYWLCREEAATIIPALVLALVGGLLRGRRRMRGSRLVVARGVMIGLVCLVAPAAGITGAVLHLNSSHYGVNLTTDTASGTFPEMYSDWTRVYAGPGVNFVPISKAQLQAVYGVSPTARSLESYLANPGYGFNRPDCARQGGCEIPGYQTIWLLRGAASQVGAFESAVTSQRFFASIDDDIDRACTTGQLSCRPRLPPGIQSLARGNPQAWWKAAKLVFPSTFAPAMYRPTANWTDQLGTRPMKAAVVRGMPSTPTETAAQSHAFSETRGVVGALGAVWTASLPIALALAGLSATWLLVRRRTTSVLAGTTLSLALLAVWLVRGALWVMVTAVDYLAASARYLMAGQICVSAAVVVMGALLMAEARRDGQQSPGDV